MAVITFEDKESIRESSLPAKNVVRAEDINEIKESVNALYVGGDAAYDFIVAASGTDEVITTGLKETFRLNRAMNLSDIRASLTGVGSTSGTTTIDVKLNGVSILSTKITIDHGDDTSVGAATDPVISTASLPDNGEITIHVDGLTGGADETGLKVGFIGTIA